MDKVVPVEPDPIDVADMKEPLQVEQDLENKTLNPPQELVGQSLNQASETVVSQVREEFSSSEGISTQDEVATDNQKSASILNGQKKTNSSQGFRDALPRYDVNPPPRYPDVAKLRGWEGTVVFEALILTNGRVGPLNILASSGYRSLDNAARKAITRWKFSPATTFGQPIDSEVEIPVTFSLKDL
jgi:TonB family protein